MEASVAMLLCRLGLSFNKYVSSESCSDEASVSSWWWRGLDYCVIDIDYNGIHHVDSE